MRKSGCVALLLSAWLGSAVGASALTLTRPDIKEGGTVADEQVFNSFGCTGKSISPALTRSGAPEHTKSFALTGSVPDAPPGRGFWLWVVSNFPADTTSLAKGAGDPKSAA